MFWCFQMKKFSTVDAVSNSRSTRYIAKRPVDVEPAVRYVGRTKHPALWGLMVKCFHHLGQRALSTAPSTRTCWHTRCLQFLTRPMALGTGAGLRMAPYAILLTPPRSTLRTSWGPRDFGPSTFGLKTAQT